MKYPGVIATCHIPVNFSALSTSLKAHICPRSRKRREKNHRFITYILMSNEEVRTLEKRDLFRLKLIVIYF